MKKTISKTFLLFWGSAICLVPVHADDYYFWLQQEPTPTYPSGQAACQAKQDRFPGLYASFAPLYYGAGDYREGQFAGGMCNMYWMEDGHSLGWIGVNFVAGSCSEGGKFNNFSAECESPNKEALRKSIGPPEDKLTCNSPVLFQGNPINIATGNKFQVETDYAPISNGLTSSSLRLVRYYNSLDGLWTHNYAARLALTSFSINLISFDGRQSLFNRTGNTATAESTELGSLIFVDNTWIYSSPDNDILIFNTSGQLISWQHPEGDVQSLSYSGSNITVIDNYGHTLNFTESANHQPLSMQVDDLSVIYSYNGFGQMTSVTRQRAGVSNVRQYYYEDSSHPTLLTGITDERGIRFATWHYDAQGRAISSEHGGGLEKVTLVYNADGSTTVTNALGKNAVYHYQVIQGVKRIVAIEGEPSPNCSASNSSYTYNDRGQVLTKTDAKGLITTYSYNDRGLEVSRTEASGTPLARTTTTEWDPSRFLKTKVVEPTRTTLYTYDAQGRQLSQQTTSN